MAESGAPVDLPELLDALTASTVQLSDLLDGERDAMISADVGQLESLNQRKTAVVETIDALGNRRRALLDKAGYSPDADGMRQYIEAQPADSAVAERWRELLDVAGRCKAQNLRNGAAGRVRQAQLRDALALLAGNQHQTPVYDATGQDNNVATRRELGHA